MGWSKHSPYLKIFQLSNVLSRVQLTPLASRDLTDTPEMAIFLHLLADFLYDSLPNYG